MPIFPVRSVRAAIAHYAKLGFDTSIHDPELDEPTYGFAVRSGVELHVTRVVGHDPAASSSACYLHVADAAQVHAAWKTAGAGGRLGDVEDKPWGKREFAHIDPDGNLVRVGSPKPG
ncbi:MAG: VOC family protein [Polyangiaceae bacterium]|nr:VOC family protein [Polyangiaceae bacterium]